MKVLVHDAKAVPSGVSSVVQEPGATVGFAAGLDLCRPPASMGGADHHGEDRRGR